GLAIDQIAQSGLSSLSVIYYSAQLFRSGTVTAQSLTWTESPLSARSGHSSQYRVNHWNVDRFH
ncbi:hypothetical protein, partial [Klebsiella michiganensis]|uniref:hypothetical protein n=1 Tax=Klebsiella michiganensis TaxID=1134687 RepID=UPI00287E2C83